MRCKPDFVGRGEDSWPRGLRLCLGPKTPCPSLCPCLCPVFPNEASKTATLSTSLGSSPAGTVCEEGKMREWCMGGKMGSVPTVEGNRSIGGTRYAVWNLWRMRPNQLDSPTVLPIMVVSLPSIPGDFLRFPQRVIPKCGCRAMEGFVDDSKWYSRLQQTTGLHRLG